MNSSCKDRTLRRLKIQYRITHREIAIFSLAFQAAIVNRKDGQITALRRIFYVVDRRIIVNEAYQRSQEIANRLRNVLDPLEGDQATEAHRPILTQVAFLAKTARV